MSQHRCCCGQGGDPSSWKMATACCPQGDSTDLVFVPSTQLCNVIAAGGVCYQVQHEPIFVDCADLTDAEFEELPDDVVCLPDMDVYAFLKTGSYHCTASDTCQDAECDPCDPATDCCAGPLNNRCGARAPTGGGTTARFHLAIRTRRLETGPGCGAGGCQSRYAIQTTHAGTATVDLGNGDCSWGGPVAFPDGQRIQAWCDGAPTLDQTYQFTASPAIYLGGDGSTIAGGPCTGAGTLANASAPAMGLTGPEMAVLARLNATGSSSYGIAGPSPGPNFESTTCRVGPIRGGKCAGVVGAWGTLTASHTRGPAEECEGQTDKVVVRALVLATTGKVGACQGAAPGLDANTLAVEDHSVSDPMRRCRGCGQ